MKKGDHVIVTGGSGFIGYHLVGALLKNKDVRVTIIDNLQRGVLDKDMTELLEHPQVSFLQLDLLDLATYKKLPTDISAVYHLAAVNGTDSFYKNPASVLRTNTLSLIYILDWIKDFVPHARLLFTSSNEAYAGLEVIGKLPFPTPENVPLIVSDVQNPRWSYGSSKLIGEMLCINYSRQFGIDAVIVRPHNFYGPRSGFGHVIPQTFEKIFNKKEPFEIYGAAETRSFCYITDAVAAMILVMNTRKSPVGQVDIYHIGDSQNEIKILDLVEKAYGVSGWRPSKIEIMKSKEGSVSRRLPSTEKIFKEYGWKPKVSFEEGLSQTWLWYKDFFTKKK